MTHPSVNSIVERLRAAYEWIRKPDYDEDFPLDEMVRWLNKRPSGVVLEAATIISELQAERDALSADLEKVQTELDEENIRALAAESSLSRIKEETEKMLHNADAALGEATAILGGEYGDHYGTLCDRMMQLADDLAAIRALGSTGGAEKTAESGNPAPTRERE